LEEGWPAIGQPMVGGTEMGVATVYLKHRALLNRKDDV
tara:strand:+ start:19639 stop:19752 length:114 start_codon:yes stop_codon:yes gene_type:complete